MTRSSGSDSATNVLKFGSGITPASVIVTANAFGDIFVTDGQTGDKIEITSMLTNKLYGVETFAFADGTTWDRATILAHEFQGTPGADNVYGDGGANTLDGKGGTDLLTGNGGADTFIYKPNYGRLTINEFNDPSIKSIVRLGTGINTSSIRVATNAFGDIIITDGIAGDGITIQTMQNNSYYGVQAVDFADGTVWDRSTILSLVGKAAGPANPAPSKFSIVASSASKVEGNSGATSYTFIISREGSYTGSATVKYAVSGAGSNPAGGADFVGGTLPSGSVTFDADEISKIVTISVAGDPIVEPDKTFAVTLTSTTVGSIATATATSTITNDDVATVVPSRFNIKATDSNKTKGAPGVTAYNFIVSRDGSSTSEATVFYGVTGTGINPVLASDFANGVIPNGSVTFTTGETSKTLTINVATDPIEQPNRAFVVTLVTSSTGSIASATASDQLAGASVKSDQVMGFSQTKNTSGVLAMDVATSDGPNYLDRKYIYAGSDSMAFSTQTPNLFIHSGSGRDAIQVASGSNVLDGGTGSNFLTGGAGNDTFFTDARGAGVVWNTIINFHAGDAATLWGFTAKVSSFYWENSVAGAAGSQGATLRANIVGGAGRTGDGIDASITFAGFSVAQAKNFQIVTGTQSAGNYLYVFNPGV